MTMFYPHGDVPHQVTIYFKFETFEQKFATAEDAWRWADKRAFDLDTPDYMVLTKVTVERVEHAQKERT